MDKDMVKVSICSPIHNEKDNLRALVDRVHRTLIPLYGHNWEQILVDDGSSDGSGRIIEELMKAYPDLVLATHPTNMGECSGWSTAFRMSKGEVVVLIAGDLQSQPENIPQLLEIVFKDGFDAGTGARRKRRDGVFYWFATRVLNLYMCLAFHLNVKDASSSFFAVRSRFIKKLRLVENDHRYILAILKRRGARIKEISVEHRPRIEGSSHYTRWKVLWAIPEVLRFTFRCLHGFYDMDTTTEDI